jgi:hypothetical protein
VSIPPETPLAFTRAAIEEEVPGNVSFPSGAKGPEILGLYAKRSLPPEVLSIVVSGVDTPDAGFAEKLKPTYNSLGFEGVKLGKSTPVEAVAFVEVALDVDVQTGVVATLVAGVVVVVLSDVVVVVEGSGENCATQST